MTEEMWRGEGKEGESIIGDGVKGKRKGDRRKMIGRRIKYKNEGEEERRRGRIENRI